MSKPGLFRALKEFFADFRAFGNPELDNLKLQAKALQKQLDQLEAMRAVRVQQEEALSLMQVQSTVQNIQHLDRMKQKQEDLVKAAVEQASAHADKQIKAMLEQKAQQVVSNLDLSKAISMDVPVEDIVAKTMQAPELKQQVDDFKPAQAVEQPRPTRSVSNQETSRLVRDKG